MYHCTVPRARWVMVPALLVIDAKARSVPTATDGLTPNSKVRSGVISEPPPTPVMPTSRPTAKPDRIYVMDMLYPQTGAKGKVPQP